MKPPVKDASSSGFVLPLVLWVIAILAFASTFVYAWVERAIVDAALNRDRVRVEEEFNSALATVLYTMVRQPLSADGFEIYENDAQMSDVRRRGIENPLGEVILGSRYIPVDGRSLKFSERTVVSIQDNGGLINLSLYGPIDHDPARYEEVRRLLSRFGVPVEERDPLINKLLDYLDPDDLKRPGGAEAPEYRERGRTLPPNVPLVTPLQLRSVLDWDRYPALWQTPGLFDVAGKGSGASMNLGTAPAAVLEIVFGITPENAESLVAERQRSRGAPYDFRWVVAPLVGEKKLNYLYNPSNTFRVTLLAPKTRQRREIGVTLTPIGQRAPWLIDYILDLPFAEAHAARAQLATSEFPFVAPVPFSR